MRFNFPIPSENLTFDDQNIFNRKNFADTLATIVTESSQPLVISIEAPWGEGKTSFARKWMNYIPLESMYIDAYKNDFQDDAFIAIAAEISRYADEKLGEQGKLPVEIVDVFKRSAKVATKIGSGAVVKMLTGMDQSSADDLMKSISDESSKELSRYIDKAFDDAKKKEATYDDIKKTMMRFSDEISGEGNNFVIVIDELDRCRPSFALEVIEKVKHVFNARGIIFVLVNNPYQLEESVRHEYGRNVDAQGYLRKFYDLSLKLPRGHTDSRSERELNEFIRNCFEHINIQKDVDLLDEYSNLLSKQAVRLNLTLRDIEKICLLISMFNLSMLNQTASRGDIRPIIPCLPYLDIGAAIIRIKNGRLFDSLMNNHVSWLDVKQVFEIEKSPDNTNDVFTLTWAALTDQKKNVANLGTTDDAGWVKLAGNTNAGYKYLSHFRFINI